MTFASPASTDDPADDLQYRRVKFGVHCKEATQRDRKRHTHWRSGTLGMSRSTSQAAVCAMRRAPQEGQMPHRLQENATSFSWLHPTQAASENHGQRCRIREKHRIRLASVSPF
jgi:hypothetical protein